MRTRTLLIAVVSLASASVAVAQSPDAKQQFQQKCSLCHGADGRSQTTMGKNLGSPDLTSDVVKKAPDAQIKTTIENGKGKMPAYGKVLGQQGVTEMIKYVRALSAKK